MARTVLPLAGAAVGFFIGGPAGAQWGYLAGSLVASAIPQQAQGPRIGETGAQTSQEGAPRAIIYGVAPVTGNVIASGPLIKRDVESNEGGKGGGTDVSTEHGYRTYAVRICEGPVAGFIRVWEDDKLVYDVRPSSIIFDDSELWLTNKVFYHGTEIQLPDPSLQMIFGVDEVPAHRGTAYMVFIEEDLTDRRGSIPQYRFEIAKEIEPASVDDISYSTTIPVYVTGGITQFHYVYLNYLHAADSDSNEHVSVSSMLTSGWAKDGSTDYLIHELDETCTTIGTVVLPVAPGGNWAVAVPVPSNNFAPLGSYGGNVLCRGTAFAAGVQLYLTGGGSMNAVLVPDGSSLDYWYADNSPGADSEIGTYLWMNAAGVYLGVRARSGTPYNAIYLWPLGSSGSATNFRVNATGLITNVCATPGVGFLMHLGRDGKLRVINDIGTYSVYSGSLALESSVSLPFSVTQITAFGVDGDVAVFTSQDGSGTMYVRSVADWSLQSTYTNATFDAKPIGNRLIFTDGSLFIQCQDAILRSEFNRGIVGQPALLSDIVADIHDRCDFPSEKRDVTELTDIVFGLVLAGDYSGADAINTLRSPYLFDCSGYDKKLHYPKRGAAVVDTLTIDDLVEIPDTSKRDQAIEFPKKLHLRYQNSIGGYAPAQATSSRSSPDVRVVGETSMETPVVFNEANTPAQKADVLHKVAWSEAEGEVKLSVPLSFIKYVPSNCFGLVLRGSVKRLRMEQMDTADGVIAYTLRHDRQSAYTSNVTGIPIPEPTPPPSTIVGDTILAVLDMSPRIDSEDDLNYLVGVTGVLPAWHGATVQRSLDGGATYTTAASVNRAAVMGLLVDDLSDASEFYTDTTNTVTVHLYRDGQTIESITDAQFLSEGGAFAIVRPDGSCEILQYRDAVQTSTGDYELSYLHRGQLNSGTSSHLVGAIFVMLDLAVHVVAQSAWIGMDLTHRAPSFDQAQELAAEQTAEFTGKSQIEWPVTSLVLSRDGSDNITASWNPRHRFGTEDAPVASINFRGFRVTLDDGVLSPLTFDTTSQTFTYDASALGDPLTVSVSSLNRITGPGPATSGSV